MGFLKADVSRTRTLHIFSLASGNRQKKHDWSRKKEEGKCNRLAMRVASLES
jgi:hypothetical protein